MGHQVPHDSKVLTWRHQPCEHVLVPGEIAWVHLIFYLGAVLGRVITMSKGTMEAELNVEPSLASVIVEHFEGSKVDGRFHGDGVARFYNGQTYAGDFHAGTMHGQGNYSWGDDTVFEGSFDRNRLTGTGRYQWADGSWYEGGVLHGLRHGHGVYSSSGAQYEGAWVHGLRHGKGVLFYDENRRSFYDGEWAHGRREGAGTMRYLSGNQYVGEWHADMKHGHGTMQWYDRHERYTGCWREGLPCGFGEHVWLDHRAEHGGSTQKLMANKYVGMWAGGERCGRGIFHYANGSCYDGEWQGNKKHGVGIFTFEDGSVYNGRFDRDRMLDGRPDKKDDTGGLLKVTLYVDDIFDRHPSSAACDEDRELVELDKVSQCGWNVPPPSVFLLVSVVRMSL